ncbi:MAG: helix-turn-helix domain-containing protein [Acidaminococcales bacterium]|jgi:transcriptional regulator with XRE-family HTH domain|nr:helix-turn-helix domain-containing protein [Acidaminococcales bacterium]
MSVFSERLRLLRSEKKSLQREMAEILKVTERHYRLCEAGKVDMPTSKLIALADYFGVSLDYLVGRSDDPEMR